MAVQALWRFLLEVDVVPEYQMEGRRMKTVMFANTMIMMIYTVCVTYAAVRFDDPSILWWYVMLGFLGFTYKSGGVEDGK